MNAPSNDKLPDDIDALKQLVDRGLRLNPYSVNDDEMIAHLIEIGVAGLITDFPQKFPR